MQQIGKSCEQVEMSKRTALYLSYQMAQMNHLDDTKGGFLTRATTQHAMAIILGGGVIYIAWSKERRILKDDSRHDSYRQIYLECLRQNEQFQMIYVKIVRIYNRIEPFTCKRNNACIQNRPVGNSDQTEKRGHFT